MEWLDIWKVEPPRNEEIIFMTGDGKVHVGEIFSDEKLRKCSFHSFSRKCDYECDLQTPLEDRVIYWHSLPKLPKEAV
jgi:hypothetical protein